MDYLESKGKRRTSSSIKSLLVCWVVTLMYREVKTIINIFFKFKMWKKSVVYSSTKSRYHWWTFMETSRKKKTRLCSQSWHSVSKLIYILGIWLFVSPFSLEWETSTSKILFLTQISPKDSKKSIFINFILLSYQSNISYWNS